MSSLPFDDEHAALFTVGQVAEMLGVQSAFVRRLDTEHVIEPARSAGGQRRYSQAEVLQIQQVARMASEGMSLPGIRKILALESEVSGLESEVSDLKQQLKDQRRK